jgi:hypothetical protein
MIARADAGLTALRGFLTADCPNWAKRSIHAECDANMIRRRKRRREKPTW